MCLYRHWTTLENGDAWSEWPSSLTVQWGFDRLNHHNDVDSLQASREKEMTQRLYERMKPALDASTQQTCHRMIAQETSHD